MANNNLTPFKLKVISWNCQSILNKVIETHDYLSTHNIDIALFTETWLTAAKNICIPNYIVHRFDRPNGAHGGVAICVRDTLNHTLLKSFNTQVIETIGISIQSLNQVISFVCCYFPGTNVNSQTLNMFKNDIKTLTNTNTSFFLVGDFNAKHRLWNNIRANQTGSLLYETICSRNLVIHHSQTPTYYPPQNKAIYPSTIDIVITNNLHSISQIVTSNVLTSDHLPIEFSIDLCEIITSPQKTTLRYDLANWQKFKNNLDNVILLNTQLLTVNDIDESLSNFSKLITDSISLSVPKKPIKSSPVLMSQHLSDLITQRNTVRRQWQRNRSPLLKSSLNSLNREIHMESFKQRNDIFNKKMSKLSPGSQQFWKATKIIKSKANVIPPLRDNLTNNIIMTDVEKANAIANEFVKSHTLTQNLSNALVINNVKLSLESIRLSNDNSFVLKTTPNEIKSLLQSLKNRKSPGIDLITNRALKNISKKALVLLNNIFNACFKLNYFPKDWKVAQIIAIPKPNKNNSNPSNYRPISLLSSLSKVFEKIILNRLNVFIEDKNLLPDEQFGFRRSHSTIHQLQRVVQHTKTNFKNKKSTGMIILDIEKAFDSIWHKGLLHKLYTMNIPINLIKIIQSFLLNRSFYVKINKESSTVHNIPAGVPQGSSLSPVLYNLYISDFPSSTNTELALFADDTAIFHSHEDPNVIINALESYVTTILEYFKRWKIKTNYSKTQAIFLTKRRALRYLPQRNISINNTEIFWSDEVKYLGLTLDKTLIFKKHTDHTCIKTQKYIKILYPLIHRKSYLNLKNKLLVYKCIFRPIMLYAGEVWGDCSICHTNKLQITQNKVLKLIYDLPFFYNTDRLHMKCNIKTIQDTLISMKSKFITRCQNANNVFIQNLNTT